MDKYCVDIETQTESVAVLTTKFFESYAKANEYYERSRKRDRIGSRYTYIPERRD